MSFGGGFGMTKAVKALEKLLAAAEEFSREIRKRPEKTRAGDSGATGAEARSNRTNHVAPVAQAVGV